MLFSISKIKQQLIYQYEKDKKVYKQMLKDKNNKPVCINKEYIANIQNLLHYQTMIELRAKHVVKVLKNYIAENIAAKTFIDGLFECEFDENVIKQTLTEEKFVRFAIKASLVNRILGLEYDTAGQVKLRIYSFILNYNKLKKELA